MDAQLGTLMDEVLAIAGDNEKMLDYAVRTVVGRAQVTDRARRSYLYRSLAQKAASRIRRAHQKARAKAAQRNSN